jgi:hypothetical protein
VSPKPLAASQSVAYANPKLPAPIVHANERASPHPVIVREIRPLGPDAVLLCAVCGMSEPGAKSVIPAVNALFQNTPAALHGRPDAVAALTEELNRALNA